MGNYSDDRCVGGWDMVSFSKGCIRVLDAGDVSLCGIDVRCWPWGQVENNHCN